jgi:hypothetical protein
LEAQYVRVVWNSDTFAGLEFQSPLHEAVLDNLLETSCDPVTPVMAELYDIALRSRNHAAKAPSAPATSELNDLADHCAAVVLEQLLNNKLPDDLHRHSVVSPTVGLT